MTNARMRLVSVLLCGLACAIPGRAQSARVIRATGEAVLSVKPDQLKINIGVVSQAATAQEAAALNATQMDAMLAKLRQALGTAGDTRTVGYSISPNYRYTQGQPPVLTGFTASNTVEATTSDLSSAGAIIDAASQAGANSISGLRFTIKNEDPVKLQALGQAARQARSHAEAIAAGLGASLGAVLSAQEGAAVVPIALSTAGAASATSTPIESGFVEIRATVTVDVQLQ